MTIELEGNLSLERAHTRRWVSIFAVVVPVAAFALLAAWFVRVYIAPPTISIPSPMMVADAPPAPPALPVPGPFAALQQQTAVSEPASPPPAPAAAPPAPATPPPADARPEPVSTVPMFGTLAVVPHAPSSAPPAYVNPAQHASPGASSVVITTLAPPEPAAGPIPIPRAKPHPRVATVPSAIPLPRPRPTEAEQPPAPATTPAFPQSLPPFDRHAIE